MLKRLLTKEEQAKKTKINQILIGGVLILIMLFSTVGYSFMNAGDNTGIVEHKGVTYIFGENSYWNFNYEGLNYATRYNPIELSDIDLDLKGLSYKELQGKIIYTAGEPDDYILWNNLYQIVSRIGRACMDDDCIEDAPLKNCSEDFIIIVNEINDVIDDNDDFGSEDIDNNESLIDDVEIGILKDENCVYITTDYQNQSRYIDKFFFGLMGLD
ncbi:hypothetical protein GOV12_05720 [Candidatus Pacearchaeota archaeon]|nr:hypothetical protein [Candidatus Pacearchaeota archaeon]